VSKASKEAFVPDWAVEEPAGRVVAPQTDAGSEVNKRPSAWTPARPVGVWGYDRDLIEAAAQDAACLGVAFQGCEWPEELAGCGVAVLLLDHLRPWGSAESIYEDARKATANTGAVLVGVSYNEEHPLAGRLPLYRTLLDVLNAVANGLLP
jgi:hypothetical protein